jgi:AbrB family looped-hinge helix DNA binding protein
MIPTGRTEIGNNALALFQQQTITMVMSRGMALAQSKVTAQGQIAVPAEVRRKLGVGPGSVLEWDEDGEKIIVRRAGLCRGGSGMDRIRDIR